MSSNHFKTDLGLILGLLIKEIASYIRRRKFSRAIVMVLLKGGIAVFSVSFIVQLILTLVFGSIFDATSTIVGFSLIAVALLLLAFDKTWSKTDLPDIEFEPVGSFFEPVQHDNDTDDANYIEGRNFKISASFRVKAGRQSVKLLRSQMFALDRGINCLSMRPEYLIGARLITSAWQDFENCSRPVCDTQNIDNSYYFQPPIPIPQEDLVNFTIARKFGPPFMEHGAPYDFRDAELAVYVDYVVDGETKTDEFFFKTNYYRNTLTKIRNISDIPYFSNREIEFYYKQGCITKSERDQILDVDPEVRIRTIESRWVEPTDVWSQHGVPQDTYLTMRFLKEDRSKLPNFDPKAIWNSKFGRIAKWVFEKSETEY